MLWQPAPDPPPQAGNVPAVILPACHVPVAVRSYVTISVNGVVICAGQVNPTHRHGSAARLAVEAALAAEAEMVA